jgi:hypothetical protein
LWAFQGAQPGDLSFAAGDVIIIVGEVEQWLEGQLNGVTGIFPSVRLSLSLSPRSLHVWLTSFQNYVTDLND